MRATDREFNTALYLLRATQIGLKIDDLEDIERGMLFDMITEQANDQEQYDYVATQEDFDKF